MAESMQGLKEPIDAELSARMQKLRQSWAGTENRTKGGLCIY